MKKLLLAAAALAALSFGGEAVQAADMKVAPVAPRPASTWAGVYFGIHGGYGWADADWRTDVTTFPVGFEQVSHSPEGYILGGQIGARWAMGPLVFGIEGTMSGARLIENGPSVCSTTGCVTAAGFGVFPNRVRETLVSELWTGTAQVGYSMGNLLGYVKGGVAGGMVRLRADNLTLAPAPGALWGTSERLTGWTVGAGAEMMLIPNFSVGIEYNYYDLQAGDNTVPNVFPTTPASTLLHAIDYSTTIHTLTAKLNVKIDWRTLGMPF